MTRVDDSSHLLKPRAADQVAAEQQTFQTEPSLPKANDTPTARTGKLLEEVH